MMTLQEAQEKSTQIYPLPVFDPTKDWDNHDIAFMAVIDKRRAYEAGYLAAAPKWMPIEYAPKDTDVVAVMPDGAIEMAKWSNVWNSWDSIAYPNQPSHFMPIPPLP